MIRILIVLLVSVAIPLHAQYLDPGTGSYILQILLAAALASVFYFRQIFAFARQVFTKVYRKFFGNDKGN
jgi:hypothetical protein